MGAMQRILGGISALQLIREGISYSAVLTLAHLSSSGSSNSVTTNSQAPPAPGYLFLYVVGKSWLAAVDTFVPEPYLDEVFHIPQAQTYCEGRLWEWDDKITTPPGLYLLSVAYHKLWMMPSCTPSSLRYINVLATVLIAAVASQCRHLIEVRAAEREDAKGPRSISWYAHHTGFNVALFPVIFFFSALYYTDVVSTLVVLLCYRNHLLRLGPRPPSLFNDFWTVLLGVAALFMRQTNVFWVVVYMGGLEVFHVLRSVQPAFQGPLSTIHDPLLSRSAPEDWLLCVLTVGVTALYNPMRVLRQIWPHITVMALFAGFVAWNGGVVLGDKSNHIATLHMAQMLYIWPLFAFFSAPLFIPSLIATLTRPFTYLKSLLSLSSWRSALISLPYILLTIFISVAVVIYNTIIHPFTLADNRHYMFYVFRYTILRSPTIRLSLVAAYTLCRWLAWDALSGISLNLLTNHSSNGQLPSSDAKPDRRPNDASSNQQQPSTQQQAAPTQSPAPVAPTSSLSPPTSTALLLFVTTALSLITAPLVEPRYFILPWVFYRLLVPSWSWEGNSSSNRSSSNSSSKRGSGSESGSESVGSSGNGKNRFRSPSARLCGWFHALDPRLVLETVWFLAGNVGTMYVFLMRPFRWRGPDGVLLDGGRAQRFMW